MNRELHADFFKIHPGWKAAGGDDAITNKGPLTLPYAARHPPAPLTILLQCPKKPNSSNSSTSAT